MEPEPSHQKLVVAYCFDDHYAKHAKVAISSLARNSKSPLKVYLVTANLGVETRGDLEKLFEKFDLDCEILELEPNRLEGFRARAHISAMAYSKLALPELIDEERLIYLDVDTLVRGNLEDLFRTDLAGFAVGGVVDPIGANSTKMPIGKKSHYINTGVLLMDLAALRASEFTARCMKVYRDWVTKRRGSTSASSTSAWTDKSCCWTRVGIVRFSRTRSPSPNGMLLCEKASARSCTFWVTPNLGLLGAHRLSRLYGA
jgi:lipopolysaccharide biosynthesis glycosyltransferase